MTLNAISSFIDSNSFGTDEYKIAQLDNEFQIAREVLKDAKIRTQISQCLEELEISVLKRITKSIEDSDKFREEGNRLFRAGDSLGACRCYTNAIFMAPENSLALTLAHANRAAALLDFGYYQDAYCDCELAITLGYPKDKKLKILMRQAHCSLKLKNYSKLEATLEKLNDLKLCERDMKEKQALEEQLKVLAEQPGSWRQEDPPCYKVQNIYTHPKKGRYMTAWKDYQKGDVILTERAFAFVPVNHATICSNCATEQFIPYPCYTCSKVFYCSQSCKLADEKIHQYECFAYKCDLIETLGIAHLAMHALIRGLPDIIGELLNCKTPEQIWQQIETIGKSNKKGYPEIISLYNNLHSLPPKIMRVLLLGSSVGASFLISHTQFPELYKDSQCSEEGWSIVISALIFRHAIQMAVNAQSSISVVFIDKADDFQALADIWQEPKHLKKRLLHRFSFIDVSFAGIYPYLSLCNHSCEPSLRLNFDGSRVISKARNKIKKGDEIFNTYVLDCRNSSKLVRQEQLESIYQFKCDCKRCLPKANDNEYLKFHKYRCSNSTCKKLFSPQIPDMRWWLKISEENKRVCMKCPSCEAVFDIDWYMQFDKLFVGNVFDVKRLKEALKHFKFSERAVHGFSDLRHHMAWNIVTSFFSIWKDEPIDEIFFKEVGKVIQYLLNHVEEQNDVESVLYTTTSTFAIDLMAEGKCFIFDNKKIRRSFDMLSTEMRTIFENYVSDFIGLKFDDKVKLKSPGGTQFENGAKLKSQIRRQS